MTAAMQYDFGGKLKPRTGNPIRDQLAELMENEPNLVRDEDMLAARWLQDYAGVDEIGVILLRSIIKRYRKADIGRRRRELREMYPYSDDEEKRRQTMAGAGPPRGERERSK